MERANRNKFLEMKFSSSEKTFFRSVLTDLDNFTKDYQSLLRELNKKDIGELSVDKRIFIVSQILEKCIDMCDRYKNLETAVSEIIEKFEHR